jgi:hypothetical protein
MGTLLLWYDKWQFGGLQASEVGAYTPQGFDLDAYAARPIKIWRKQQNWSISMIWVKHDGRRIAGTSSNDKDRQHGSSDSNNDACTGDESVGGAGRTL